MEPLILKNEQKKNLFDGLQRHGFDPAHFELATIPLGQLFGQQGQALRYKGTKYKFGICKNLSDYVAAKFIVEYSPGREELTETEECHDWTSVFIAFGNWLDFLKAELAIGDPWEGLKNFSKQVQSMPKAENERAPANAAETVRIQQTLNEIKQLLLKQAADDEKKMQYIVERFDVLTDAATSAKFSKRDYLMLVYEAVIGIAVNIGTRPDVISQIGTLLHELLAKLPQILALQ